MGAHFSFPPVWSSCGRGDSPSRFCLHIRLYWEHTFYVLNSCFEMLEKFGIKLRYLAQFAIFCQFIARRRMPIAGFVCALFAE